MKSFRTGPHRKQAASNPPDRGSPIYFCAEWRYWVPGALQGPCPAAGHLDYLLKAPSQPAVASCSPRCPPVWCPGPCCSSLTYCWLASSLPILSGLDVVATVLGLWPLQGWSWCPPARCLFCAQCAHAGHKSKRRPASSVLEHRHPDRRRGAQCPGQPRAAGQC